MIARSGCDEGVLMAREVMIRGSTWRTSTGSQGTRSQGDHDQLTEQWRHVTNTGDKGWWIRQVHCRYIARTWTMYPPKTHPVHCKHI